MIYRVTHFFLPTVMLALFVGAAAARNSGRDENPRGHGGACHRDAAGDAGQNLGGAGGPDVPLQRPLKMLDDSMKGPEASPRASRNPHGGQKKTRSRGGLGGPASGAR